MGFSVSCLGSQVWHSLQMLSILQVAMTVQSILAQTKYLGFGIKIISTDFHMMSRYTTVPRSSLWYQFQIKQNLTHHNVLAYLRLMMLGLFLINSLYGVQSEYGSINTAILINVKCDVQTVSFFPSLFLPSSPPSTINQTKHETSPWTSRRLPILVPFIRHHPWN